LIFSFIFIGMSKKIKTHKKRVRDETLKLSTESFEGYPVDIIKAAVKLSDNMLDRIIEALNEERK